MRATHFSCHRRPGRGILLAWLLFIAVLVFAEGGVLLIIRLNNKESPQVSVDIPGPKSAPTVAFSPPPDDLPAPPTNRAKEAAKTNVKEPTEDTPPPLPAPPPLPPPPKGKQERPQAPQLAQAPQVSWLLPREQQGVDMAIDRGVEFLRRQQHDNGSWGNQTGGESNRHTAGLTALAALTLLECGVRANDPQVQLAARYLRQQMANLNATYSVSLALLFFDRLGETQDIPRIRTLALRLIAGQKPSGGWDYYCPRLRANDELGLLALLYKDRPRSSLELFLTQMDKPSGLESDLYRPRPSPVPPLDLFITQAPDAGTAAKTKASPAPQPVKDLPPPLPAKERANPPADKQRLSEKALAAAQKLSPALKKTPALNSATLLRGKPNDVTPRTDNSNTQFAILGLLAAERYDVPLERVVALIDWRFRGTQSSPGGTWHYYGKRDISVAMTGAGLLGLALKHGLLLPNAQNRGRNILVRDPLIQTSFDAWGQQLTRYLSSFGEVVPLEKLDIYVLWTMERVAVLYDRRTIGNLEWYTVGAQLLLPLQQDNGSWSPAAMMALNEPVVSTSFALLFLKRSNLARDLTERLNTASEPRP